MTNTRVGIYNYKHCIDIHIPATGAQDICDALYHRMHDIEYASIIDRKYSDLLTNAMHTLIYWRDHPSRKIHSFASTAQRNIWNAYCMAIWDKTALRTANIDNGYIKYHLAEEFEVVDDNDMLREQELTCEQDHWNEGTSGEHTFERQSPGWS